MSLTLKLFVHSGFFFFFFLFAGEAEFRDVHCLHPGLADSFPSRSDSSPASGGLRRQPENGNQGRF